MILTRAHESISMVTLITSAVKGAHSIVTESSGITVVGVSHTFINVC